MLQPVASSKVIPSLARWIAYRPSSYAILDIMIVLEHLAELANVSDEAVQVIGVGAIIPAGEPVREADDRLQL
jgi:hypothetical protein